MKRSFVVIVSALIAAASVCSLAGCGSKEASQAQSAAASAASSAVAAADAGNGAFSDTDVVANIKGVNVELNTEIEPIVEALGEPKDVSSQTTCHGTEGEDNFPSGHTFTAPANVTVKGIGVYTGETEGTFTIKPLPITVSTPDVLSTYNGYFQTYMVTAGANDVVTEIDYFYTV